MASGVGPLDGRCDRIRDDGDRRQRRSRVNYSGCLHNGGDQEDPSFDGLFALVRCRLHADPLSGHLFIFRNRSADRLKVLYWGGHAH